MPTEHETKPAYVGVTSATRLRMQAVRRHDTAPEMLVRRVLHAMGYRFRLHHKDLPGSPDIVLPRHRKVILVHGCFWHGHEQCKRAKRPTKNAETWQAKIDGNRIRDAKNVAALYELGWDVLVVWECQMRNHAGLATRLREFLPDLRG
jgi:DNA mismatch endonuclease, patch repair protein